MDLITPLPVSNGYDAVLVVMDRFTKMMKVIPTKSTVTAKQLATQFIDRVLCEHGIPATIISDRDSKFMSAFWQHLFEALQTKLCPSTAFHPESDG